MKKKSYWFYGLIGMIVLVAAVVFAFWPKPAQAVDDPWAHLPEHPIHTSHADIITGPFSSGEEVTATCLTCHPDAAKDIMMTSHWTWESEPFDVPWREEPVTIGKFNQLNNFCISAMGNQAKCASCHIGQGWSETDMIDGDPRPQEETGVDCLVCHASSGYAKGGYGNPAEGVDLVAAAQSVAAPDRAMCGKCHMDGGGGNGVKHGDMDESLIFPDENLDVHMGEHDMLCTDCHVTEDHVVKGRIVADNITIDPDEQVSCTQCHSEGPHDDERLNQHTNTLACQTCHVPSFALKDPTKLSWDWSTSGQDLGDDHFSYLKIKGTFVYDRDVMPTYSWYNGNLDYRYIIGDEIDPEGITYINDMAGDITDPNAKIFPFKLHVTEQPYDAVYNTLLAPITGGPDGYWTTFDWNKSFELAQERLGVPYSGEYGFATTYMYWPSTHMVQPKEAALQCVECHSDNGRLDWEALGYLGDPIKFGARFDN